MLMYSFAIKKKNPHGINVDFCGLGNEVIKRAPYYVVCQKQFNGQWVLPWYAYIIYIIL